LSKVSETNKASMQPASSASPEATPVANLGSTQRAQNSGELRHSPYGVSVGSVVQGEASRMETDRAAGTTDTCQNSSDANIAEVGTEAMVARDTFEGMLETLSRAKDSIARATRHALDCAKFGITNQVI
jgi:hypothetical protein